MNHNEKYFDELVGEAKANFNGFLKRATELAVKGDLFFFCRECQKFVKLSANGSEMEVVSVGLDDHARQAHQCAKKTSFGDLQNIVDEMDKEAAKYYRELEKSKTPAKLFGPDPETNPASEPYLEDDNEG